jgi:aspartate/methionine/tyrosine aminotransferase
MFLIYAHNTEIPGRHAEGDAAANLLRKGWVEATPPVEPVAVPEPITKVETWALREACMIAGYTAQIEAAIAALPNPQKAVATNRWEYKPEIRRNDPLIAALIQILGWTTEQADALFTSANAIQNS